jgi:ribosome biogenesis protein MAK21
LFYLIGKRIEYTGDPLQDLSLIRFLDRYVFKNPKRLESKRVVKKNDPLAQRAAYIPQGIRTIPVDSLSYLNEREDRIPVDELFLYQYMHKQKEIKGIKKEPKYDEDDNESVNSEDFNDMLDKLSKKKHLDDLDVAGDFAPKKKSKGKLSKHWPDTFQD